ncbi:MAG: sialate O-acetylesterase, partial [Verrucomicrobiota bacterium]
QFQPRTPAKPAVDGKKLPRQYGNFNLKTKGGFGPEIGMVRTLATKESHPLAVIKTAFSGTSVAGDWNVALPGKADPCYRAMVDESKAAIAAAKAKGVTLRPRAFVWVQGESDANAKDAPAYAANLSAMLKTLRTIPISGPKPPLVFRLKFPYWRGSFLPSAAGLAGVRGWNCSVVHCRALVPSNSSGGGSPTRHQNIVAASLGSAGSSSA